MFFFNLFLLKFTKKITNKFSIFILFFQTKLLFQLQKMVQYEIADDGSSIRIIYGSDEKNGVFLRVIDRRLEMKAEASDEANKVVKKISKDGHYLSLTTSLSNFYQI